MTKIPNGGMTKVKSFNLDSIDLFQSFCQLRGMSPETLKAYRTDLIQLHSAIGDQFDSNEFDLAAAEWITDNRRAWKPRTTLRKLAAIRSCAKFLGWVVLVDYHAPSPERLTAHPLDGGMDDVRKLIGACKTGREQALVALCGFCGLRISEALAVTVMDFDFKDRTLLVRNGKGAKDRTIPVHPDAWPALFAGINDQPFNDKPIVHTGNRNARRLLTEIGARCGIKLASHDLRSTLLTAMYRATKDIRATQEMAGHSTSQTTEGYTLIRMDDMRNALNVL